jgi:nucleoside phosphorylase
MENIGLIAAMQEESDALLRRVNKPERIKVGPYRGFRFELAGRTCILVTSGMGVRRAAEATRLLIAEHHPQLLISFGIAGAVEPDLEIGDVVAAESFCQLEAGVPGPRQPLAALPEAAREAVVRALAACNTHFFIGTAVTTSGTQLHHNDPNSLTHPILEMETAGIAQAAAGSNIPLLVLRAISDGPRAPIPFDLGEVMDADANMKIGVLLQAVIRNPKIILQSGQLMQNSRLAEENAAAAVIAALGSGGWA